MYHSGNAQRFLSAMRRAGELVYIEIDGLTYKKRAVVQNAGKNFMRKYDDEFRNRRDLGRALRRDKIAFIPYFDDFDDGGALITVSYRGKRYVVAADSVMNLGDEPCYIWALLREIGANHEEYYDDFEP